MASGAAVLYCLEVGQGSCAVIVDAIPGAPPDAFQATIVDAGVSGPRLAQWLSHHRIKHIAAIILTHNDADHTRGAPVIVAQYRKRIGRIYMLVDRATPPARLWLDAQRWWRKRWVGGVDRLEVAAQPQPGAGATLVGPPDVSYRLCCAYPTMFDAEAVAHGAERLGDPLGHGPNATSAVLRLATDAPGQNGAPGTAEGAAAHVLPPTRVLFGADLDYPGWKRLAETGHDLRADVFIVAHHGAPAAPIAPRGGEPGFGPDQLARAVQPRFAVVSVGTGNRYGHPDGDLLAALRGAGSTILCTQLTAACVDDPLGTCGRHLLAGHPAVAMRPVTDRGTACAGHIQLTLSPGQPPQPAHLDAHQRAVDELFADGHHPLCRR